MVVPHVNGSPPPVEDELVPEVDALPDPDALEDVDWVEVLLLVVVAEPPPFPDEVSLVEAFPPLPPSPEQAVNSAKRRVTIADEDKSSIRILLVCTPNGAARRGSLRNLVIVSSLPVQLRFLLRRAPRLKQKMPCAMGPRRSRCAR